MAYDQFTNGPDSENHNGKHQALWKAVQADPDGYLSNRNFGLYCAKIRTITPLSEPYLLKALSGDAPPDDVPELLEALGGVYSISGKYELALNAYELLSKMMPDHPLVLRTMGDLYYLLGHMDKASDTLKHSISALSEYARASLKERGGPDRRTMFGGALTVSHIGEFAYRPDMLLKAKILGLTEQFDPVLMVLKEQVCNTCLLEYWSDLIEVIMVCEDSPAAAINDDLPEVHADCFSFADGRTLPRDLALPVIMRQWEEKGNQPLLRLSDEHRALGKSWLRSQGVPEDAWFVCLHVRESATYEEDVPWSSNKFRNADIENYIPMIKAVTKRGGWVVRVGDPSMKEAPDVGNLIDYARADDRQDWIDIYSIAAARFFVGLQSGPYNVASVFGVPIVGTDWFPLGSWAYSGRDLIVHKRLRDAATGRFLSIKESLQPPLFTMMSPIILKESGIEVFDNTPLEIRDAAVEMMDRLDGLIQDTDEDEALQKKYFSDADPYDVGWPCRVGKSFLRQHPELL